MIKVSKFGGSSLADAERIKNVAKIIRIDADRRFIVVSAPGARYADDVKITDLLFRCAECRGVFETCFGQIYHRFVEIVEHLSIDLDIKSELNSIKKKILEGVDKEYIVSRGEYLNAKILACYLGFEFVDAVEIIRFNGKRFDAQHTRKMIFSRLKEVKNAVIPGFYGKGRGYTIKVFSRGGSDYSGAIIADGINADLYENWTDVDGFRATDPRIIKNAVHIDQLSYDEAYSLACMGATVLHSNSVLPLKRLGIRMEVKNTFNPSFSGTIISLEHNRKGSLAAGIAVKRNCSLLIQERKMPAPKSILTPPLKANIPYLDNDGLFKRLYWLLDKYGMEKVQALAFKDGVFFIIDSKLQEGERELFSHYGFECENVTLFTVVGFRDCGVISRASRAIEKIVKIIAATYTSNGDFMLAFIEENNADEALKCIYEEFYK